LRPIQPPASHAVSALGAPGDARLVSTRRPVVAGADLQWPRPKAGGETRPSQVVLDSTLFSTKTFAPKIGAFRFFKRLDAHLAIVAHQLEPQETRDLVAAMAVANVLPSKRCLVRMPPLCHRAIPGSETP